MSKLKLRGPAAVAPRPAAGKSGLFGAPDPGRRCGECAACCVTLGIAELNKPPGTPCAHLGGRGCGIYNQRPSTCRDWACLWKRSEVIPAESRPDKCGVMFFFEAHAPPRFMTEHGYFVGHSLTDAAAFETESFRTAMARMIERFPHVPIWLSNAGQKMCVYPSSPLLDVIEGRSRDPALLPEAVRWVEAYAPLANATVGAHSWLRNDSWRSRYAPAPATSLPGFGGPLRLT